MSRAWQADEIDQDCDVGEVIANGLERTSFYAL